MTVQYEKTFQGAHKFYALNADNILVTRQYIGYTKAQGLRLFKHEVLQDILKR